MFPWRRLVISSGIIQESRAYYSLIALSASHFLCYLISASAVTSKVTEMMTPTAMSQIVEQILRVVVMLCGSHLVTIRFAVGGRRCEFRCRYRCLGAFLVLLYYYYKLPKAPTTGEKALKVNENLLKRFYHASSGFAFTNFLSKYYVAIDG